METVLESPSLFCDDFMREQIQPPLQHRCKKFSPPELFMSHGKLVTSYPEVNLILHEVLTGIQPILGDQIIGMYLCGSLTSGSFDRLSDVDYVVVTKAVLSDDLLAALDILHQRIASMDIWCATQLEGIYIPQAALRKYDPIHGLHVLIDRGRGQRLHRMYIADALTSHAWWGGWVLLRENLREHGITLTGPDPCNLISPISAKELQEASAAILHGWAAPLLDNQAEISSRGYQAYIVLTLCRILYTLEHASVTSKQIAAKWAQEKLDQRWRPLIEQAWVGRQNPYLQAEEEDVNETLDFIRSALARCQLFESIKRNQ